MKKHLKKREMEVLKLRYGIGSLDGNGMTLEEVGKVLGVTRERIRQIEAKAIRSLSKKKEIKGLVNYMDYPDIASLAVPKPMLFISGDKDKLFPVPGVEKAFARMHEVWGETDRLETRIEAQPHECNLKNQNDILSFFDKYLNK
jgi:transcriptional regulator with XRE-family HTH domain